MRYIYSLVFIALAASVFGQDNKWSLQECIDYAMKNNIAIKTSELQTQISEYSKTQAKLDLLPSLNASGTHGYNWGQTIDPFTNQFATRRVRTNSVGISSQVTLFGGFQKLNQIKKSEYDYKAAKASADQQKNDVALSIANFYVNVLFAQDLLEIAENQLEISQLQKDRIKKLVEVGQLPKSNLLDAESQLALDEATMVQRENDLALAYLSLYQVLQLQPDMKIEVEEPELLEVSSSFLSQNPLEIYKTAVENLPQIKASEFQVKSAEKSLDIAQGAALPSITARTSYGSGYSGNNRVLRSDADPTLAIDTIGIVANSMEEVVAPRIEFQDSDFRTKNFSDQLNDNINYSVSFSLVIPLFNGYGARTAVKQQRLNAQISNYQLQQTKNTLLQDIERAYADAKASLKSYEAAKKSKDAAEEAFKYADIRYTQNLINQVEFSNAKVRLSNALLELSRSKFDFIFKVKVLEFYKGEQISF
ncbi:TolC family protein [Luteibaculum oceani]|uniref:TolC family protein n=1 Tax=Luteibaculum oceani TaxID=1294296 RepID=A0A5C6UTR9_9FLAO|nr:TolC family protein [Luteibaculum oceani]TXC75631.1 TolC family protein [Luteibaculum oceani]